MAKPNILSKRQLALLIGGLAVGAHLPTAWAAADVPKQSGGLRNWLDTELRKFRSEPHLDKAYRLVAANRLEEARVELALSLTGDPDNLLARLSYADVLTRLKRPEAAAAEFERAVALAPDNLHARLSYADTLQRLRRHDQALAQVDEVLARDPKLIAALQRRAHLQQLQGNFSAAQEAWTAIADHPAVPVRDRTQALSSAADLALRTGQHGQAVTLLDGLERAGPDYTLYFRRGLAHDTLGNAAKASADYQKALELAPDTGQRVRLLDALARIAQQRGDAALARRHFEQAMALDPRNVVRTRTLLQEAQRAGARDAAERWSRHLVDLTHSPSDREYLANLLYARQRYSEAAEEYLKVASATQDRRLRHSAYLAMGNALAAAKRPDGAVRAFADAARLKPDRRTLEALLNAQQVSGQLAETIGTLSQLLRVSPSDARRQQFAQLLEEHGKPVEAARELKHLTSNGSTLATRRGAWRQLGYLQERQGDLRAARAAYAGWIELAPRDPQAHQAAAELSLKLGESRDAARRFESAAQLAPSVEILRRLVDVHTELGDLARATEAWSRITGLREASAGQRAEAFERLANLHAAAGQPIESIMAFRAAIELGRDTSATRKGLAYALFGQSRWEEALVQFDALAAREPSADVALHRSRSLKALGRHDESARVLDQLAATLDPATGGALLRSVHVELGHLYLAQKRPVRAIQAWERALAIEPGADLALRLAAAQLEAGRVDAAERSLALTEAAAFKAPESALRDDLRARVLAERKQWAQARDTLARAQAVEPSADRAYRLGQIAQELRQPEMAVEQYRAADAIKPDPLFAESMGYVLYAQERFQEAAQAFDTAIARDPDRTRLFRDQAYAHMRSNDNEGALKAFHRAIEHREAELGLTSVARAKVPETASRIHGAAARASAEPAPAQAELADGSPAVTSPGQSSEAAAFQPAIGAGDAAAASSAGPTGQPTVFSIAATPEPPVGATQWIRPAAESARRPNPASAQARAPSASERIERAAALSRLGQHEASIDELTLAIASDPPRPIRSVAYRDLAQVYAQAREAARSADVPPVMAQSSSPEPVRAGEDPELERLKREARKLSSNWSFRLYQSYRDNASAASSVAASAASGGVVPSQGGAEVAWRPPVIGLRDDRTFEVVARTLWSNKPNAIAPDSKSLQGALGVRYKPMRSQDLYLSAERLIKMGDASRDDWLLRASWGWTDGYDIQPGRDHWNYSSVYLDVGRFLKSPASTAVYAEARQGRTFRVGDDVLFTPHLVATTRRQSPDADNRSYSEVGAGVSLRYLFGATRYESHRGNLEVLLQYKKGVERTGSGFALTTVWSF